MNGSKSRARDEIKQKVLVLSFMISEIVRLSLNVVIVTR